MNESMHRTTGRFLPFRMLKVSTALRFMPVALFFYFLLPPGLDVNPLSPHNFWRRGVEGFLSCGLAFHGFILS